LYSIRKIAIISLNIENIWYLVYQKLTNEEFDNLWAQNRSNTEFVDNSLKGAELSEEQASCLAEALKHNTSIRLLSLCNVKLSETSQASLLDALKANKHIAKLLVNSSTLNLNGIIDLLNCNRIIQSVHIYGKIGNIGARVIFESLAQNDHVTADISLYDGSIDQNYLTAITNLLKLNKQFSTACFIPSGSTNHKLKEQEKEIFRKIGFDIQGIQEQAEQRAIKKVKWEKNTTADKWRQQFAEEDKKQEFIKLLNDIVKQLEGKQKKLEELRGELDKEKSRRKKAETEENEFLACITLQLLLGIAIDYSFNTHPWSPLIGFTTIGLLAGRINVAFNSNEGNEAKQFYFAQKSAMMASATSILISTMLSSKSIALEAGSTLICTPIFLWVHGLCHQQFFETHHGEKEHYPSISKL
jgi:F0F1-type ATP synthase assembly protein I